LTVIRVDGAFVLQVGEAFKNCASVLALSRSPLAHGAIVTPGLVLDDLSPTLDERGQALRLALQWTVEQLAPEPASFPFGIDRPLDDPAWRDPHWWRYNILRHRYLEPLTPDHFVEGGRFIETLLSLTGMSSIDVYYDERARAMRDAAQWLQRHMHEGLGSDRIQALALAAVYAPLREQRRVETLLGIATVFNGVFPTAWLLSLAQAEGLVRAPEALDSLVARRCLHVGDNAASAWMSAPLRQYVIQRQLTEVQRRRHQLVAQMALKDAQPLSAARHAMGAGNPQQAATILLQLDEDERTESGADVIQIGRVIQQDDLAPAQWREVNLLLAELYQRAGQSDEALSACREALKNASGLAEQAHIYRRLGKLYEEQNQQQAFTYYQMALDRLTASDAELGVVYKDRGWLRILRREWIEGESDLMHALEVLPVDAHQVRADVLDAFSSVRRGQANYPEALEFARASLSLREQSGDLLRVGKSFNSLGILYRMMGDYRNAIQAYREARTRFEKLDNQGLVATALLNIGTAHHFSEELAEAEDFYRQCLTLADEVGLPLTEVRARSNLCEALMDQGREAEARRHWRAAYALSMQAGFDDEIAYLKELCARYPALQSELSTVPAEVALGGAWEGGSAFVVGEWNALDQIMPVSQVDEVEAVALDIAQRAGRVNAATLMETGHVSKATATRKLARMVEAGLLFKSGQGRGTYYTRAHSVPAVQIAGDLAGLQMRLDAVLPRFAQKYGLERLEAKTLSHSMAVGGEMIVRYDVRPVFRRLPDLQSFFDLERSLGESTRTSINLVP
jgi:tetratricopeptide (TPR) repeat protein